MASAAVYLLGCPNGVTEPDIYMVGTQQHLINGKAGVRQVAWILHGRRAQSKAVLSGSRDQGRLPGGSGTELNSRGGEGWGLVESCGEDISG